MSTNRPRNTPQTTPRGERPPARPQSSGRPPTRPQGSVRVTPTRPRNSPPPAPTSGLPLMGMILGGALLVIALIVVGSIYLTNKPATAPAATPNTSSGGASSIAGSAGSQATVGAGDTGGSAGVALVETPKGNFKIQLYGDPAVKGTVKNFVDKVNSGFFNNKIFHRVEDWVIQGGDPTGTGTGGGNMPGEYTAHPFITGAVGMASTAGHAAQVNDSQWFVVKKDSQFLNNNYVIFGQVIEGIDVVDKIAIKDTMTKVTMQP